VAEHRHDLVLLPVERAQPIVGLDELFVALDVGVLEGFLTPGRAGMNLLAFDGVGERDADGLEIVELFLLERLAASRPSPRSALP
jgi:hypothetical protein